MSAIAILFIFQHAQVPEMLLHNPFYLGTFQKLSLLSGDKNNIPSVADLWQKLAIRLPDYPAASVALNCPADFFSHRNSNPCNTLVVPSGIGNQRGIDL